MFNTGAPAGAQDAAYFDCNSSAAAPTTDYSLALILGASSIGMAADEGHPDDDGSPQAIGAAVLGVAAAIYATSAIYGTINAVECAEAKNALRERIHSH